MQAEHTLSSVVQVIGTLCFVLISVHVSMSDIRSRRVSNRQVLVLLLCGAVAVAIGGAPNDSLAMGLAGSLIGLACLLPLWLLGMLGAGDVKYFAAASLWVGPSLAWRAALIAALLGGLLGVVMLIRRSGVRDALNQAAVRALHQRAFIEAAAVAQNPQHGETLPYAVPMAIGLALAWFFPEFLRSLV
jgi:prepilin peptidase CpaA